MTENAKAATEKEAPFRKTFFNLSIFQFLTFLRRGVFYTFMIDYLYALMKTVTSTATLGTLNMIASSIGQNFLWGRICDKYKIRAKLIIIGETIAAASYIIVFLVHRSLIGSGNNFAAGLSIIIGLSILEFFWSMSDVGWAALLTDITTSRTRGGVIGAMNFIASLGRMAGILYSGFLYNDGEGFRSGTIFYIVTIMLLIGAALMAFTSRSIKAQYTAPQQTIAPQAENKGDKLDKKSEKTYWWFLASLIIIILGAASVNQIFLLFVKLPQGLNFTDTEKTLVLSAWTIGGMITSLAAGKLSDLFGRTKVFLSGLILAAITPLFYSYATAVPLMALIYGLNGVSFWTIQTVGFVLAGDLIPQAKRGRLFSRYNAVMALSWGPAGVLIGGPLADLQVQTIGMTPYSAYVNAFYISSILVFIGTALFATKIGRTRPK